MTDLPTPDSPYPISISEMRTRYLQLFTGAVNDVLRFKHNLIHTCLPASFAPLREGMKLAGQAFTVKGGPDITTTGEFETRAKMLEAIGADTVVVWDCSGDTITAHWGEVMTMAVMQRGCRGAVVNGIRDTQAILEQGFPVFHQYRISAGMLGRFRLHHYMQPILMGEATVNPGDWIFGDIDGVLAIPRAVAYEVLVDAEKLLTKEIDIKEMVRSGMRPTEVVARGGYF